MRPPDARALTLFRLFVRLLPFDFRREYEREMELALVSELNEARNGRSRGVWSTLVKALAGIGPLAVREHLSIAWQDLAYAVRMLVQNPAFTATALLSLALGIGANTAVFSLVDTLFFQPLPVDAPDRLVVVYTEDARNPGPDPSSYPNYVDYRDSVQGLSGLAAYTWTTANLVTRQEPIQVLGQIVTGNYFPVLGVRPALGRFLAPDDDRPGGSSSVVVLSDGLWTRQFAANPDIVGQTVRLNGFACTVVGVAPRDFTGTDIGLHATFWVPTSLHDRLAPATPDLLTERRMLTFFMIGRLKPGISRAEVDAQLGSVAARLEREYPEANRDRRSTMMPLRTATIDPSFRPMLVLAAVVVSLIVAVVLLIACVNVANLLLGRAAARRTEIAVRIALGASRGRLVRQFFTEQLLLAFSGAAIGIGLSELAWRAFWTLRPTNTVVVVDLKTGVDGRVLAFTVAISVATSLVFGLVPMLQVWRSSPVDDLRQRGAGASHRRWGMRSLLLQAEVALSIVALVTAGLFVRSFQNARQIRPGFAAERLAVASFDLAAQGYDPPAAEKFTRSLVTRVRQLPGVSGAAVSTVLPMVGGGFGRTVFVEGDAPPPGGNGQFVATNAIGPGYLDVMGLPLLAGRGFAEYDRAEAPAVAIVNQTMARRFWPGKDPIGRRFHFFGERSVTVVGTTVDSKVERMGEAPVAVAYLPLPQWGDRTLTLNVRTTGNPASALDAMRAEIRALDPTLPVLNLGTMTGHLSSALWTAEAGALVLGAFAAIALTLALIGLYGVLSYSIAVRSRELAIRMALGAAEPQILFMLAGETLKVTWPAVAIGLAASAVLGHYTSELLYNVAAIDVPTFSAVPAVFLVTAAVAAYRPARRASRLNPTTALKSDA